MKGTKKAPAKSAPAKQTGSDMDDLDAAFGEEVKAGPAPVGEPTAARRPAAAAKTVSEGAEAADDIAEDDDLDAGAEDGESDDLDAGASDEGAEDGESDEGSEDGESTDGAEDGEGEEGSEDDAEEFSDEELDLKVRVGDVTATLRELVESHKNRFDPEAVAEMTTRLNSEIAAYNNAVTGIGALSKNYRQPHRALAMYTKEMIEAKILPPDAMKELDQVFRRWIQTGKYNPQAVDANAERESAQREIETLRKNAQQQAVDSEVQRDFEAIRGRFGASLSKEDHKILRALVLNKVARGDQKPNLVLRAFNELRAQGKIKVKVKTGDARKKASRLRSRLPAAGRNRPIDKKTTPRSPRDWESAMADEI